MTPTANFGNHTSMPTKPTIRHHHIVPWPCKAPGEALIIRLARRPHMKAYRDPKAHDPHDREYDCSRENHVEWVLIGYLEVRRQRHTHSEQCRWENGEWRRV